MFKPIYILSQNDILQIDTSSWIDKLIVAYAVFEPKTHEIVKIMKFEEIKKYFEIEKSVNNIKIFNPLQNLRFGVLMDVEGTKYLRSYRKIIIKCI